MSLSKFNFENCMGEAGHFKLYLSNKLHPTTQKIEWLGAGMVICICLGRGADLHMVQLMPLTLTISCCSKSKLVLHF